MTHIENIPHILQYGITHATSPNANPDFVSIGDGSVISTRNNFLLKNENDLDLKRRKEAEFLVLGDIELSAILDYFVYNEAVKEKMLTFGINETKVHIKPQYYF